MQRVLVCDDEELIRQAIADQLSADGYAVATAGDGEEALSEIEGFVPDALLLDLKLPRLDGLGVLRRLREQESRLPVIVMTAHGAIDTAIEATKLGAFAYLSKPFDPGEISLHLSRALGPLRDEGRLRYGALLGRSPAIRRVFDVLTRLEKVDAPTVLVVGETGTGKDVVAQTIHARGPRKDKPYMAIDCASIPATLIESELFGHERGSFTDAHQTKKGLFELAQGGVIFLDEIGEMAISTQAKLLRAIESRKFRRVGGVVDVPLDSAIIAATNRDLREEVRAGRFREDLFFRLNVVPVEIPPLRQRQADVELLATHLTRKIATELKRNVNGVDAEALSLLGRHPWPGNVRELRNVIERAMILKADDGPIRMSDLPRDFRAATPAGPGRGAFELPEEGIDLAEVERDFLLQALARAQGNQTKAAKLLGITRFALRYRLEKHGVGGPSKG